MHIRTWNMYRVHVYDKTRHHSRHVITTSLLMFFPVSFYRNLSSPASGDPVIGPTQDMVLGRPPSLIHTIRSISCHLKPHISDGLITHATVEHACGVWRQTFHQRISSSQSYPYQSLPGCTSWRHRLRSQGRQRPDVKALQNPIWVKRFWHIRVSFVNWSTDIYCSWHLSASKEFVNFMFAKNLERPCGGANSCLHCGSVLFPPQRHALRYPYTL